LTGFPSAFNLIAHRTSALKITYLSTGGEAVLVETSPTEKILINLAGDPREVERIILPFLYSRGITKLDALILTDGKKLEEKLSELLREIKVKEIWVEKEKCSTFEGLYGPEIKFKCLEELKCTWSKVKVFSIYPDKNFGRGTEGENPLLMVSYGRFKLLLAENLLPESLAREQRPDIVSFNPREENLNWIRNYILCQEQVKGFVISGYKAIKYSKAKRDKVFQTSRAGAVSIEADKKRFRIKTVLEKRKLSQSL
jgi:hypothetical protein